ncbi:MAG TPA: ATP-binding protein [Burkholderiaceae bacterium]|nr:ATP-binding protein [Burkholderiaceae bacterium]
MTSDIPAGPPPAAAPRWRRAALWTALGLLLAVAQALLVFLALQYEEQRAQERTEAAAGVVADEARQVLARSVQSVQLLAWTAGTAGVAVSPAWHAEAAELLRARREVLRIEQRDAGFHIVAVAQSPAFAALFAVLPRESQLSEAEAACNRARRAASPMFSRSYFAPLTGGQGVEVFDLCLPPAGRDGAQLLATLSLQAVLETALAADASRVHEAAFVEGDGARLARAGSVRGAGVYRADRVVDLPGGALQLRLDSGEGRPHLIPNLSVALVVGLSIALTAVVLMLARDVRRRAAAEEGLGDALALRKAMENSLVTGLRVRDLQGRITYVNPAFCRMVGFDAGELLAAEQPPYWPPERARDYETRQAQRLGGQVPPGDAQRGYETVFLRKSGERFPAMVYEAPLVDAAGRHTGWLSAVVDLTEQRRVEDLSRQQQERLQATARLATVGEMASLLSHELNQPLAAIASFASGSLNLLDDPDPRAEDRAMLRQAVARIVEQAERAGRTIKSVHDFVRRREQAREALSSALLIDAVLPLVRLQARKSGAHIVVDIAQPPPRVWADRTMVEQVLLNLTRNGIQAMEGDETPLAARVLRLAVRPAQGDWVEFAVVDAGPGIPAEVAPRLFTPFFTTRAEGMGLGLSLCRTVVEQHGGALVFDSGPGGTSFRFTLRAAG